ncbi:HD domain-containing protein [Streptomyces sp. NPDC059679]|uniref:HD domain-containing protein n=1 Tax=Streptomyces sp. NPDC059679 TaxID=3346903 RepID=UPI003687EB2E
MRAVPSGPRLLAPRQAVVEHVLEIEAPSIAHHSLRSYFFALKVAEFRRLGRDVDYDDDALFFAAVLHDLGLSDQGEARPDRFEVAGADMAAEFLARHGVPSEVRDVVWHAIALHTSPGITQRRSIVCDLASAGTGADLGYESGFVSDDQAAVINEAFPRLDINTAIGRLIRRTGRAQPRRQGAASVGRGLFLPFRSRVRHEFRVPVGRGLSLRDRQDISWLERIPRPGDSI